MQMNLHACEYTCALIHLPMGGAVKDFWIPLGVYNQIVPVLGVVQKLSMHLIELLAGPPPHN